jgi:nucleoid-associated protein YgaU
MEELHQDSEKMIQQLRLLLAAREEELNVLRGRLDTGEENETGESITDQLIQELEQKKVELAGLQEKMEELRAKAQEKLSELVDELDEKDKLIASLKNSSPESAPEGDLHGSEELQNALAEINRLKEALAKAKSSTSDLQPAADDEERAQEEAERLREQLKIVREEMNTASALYEQNVFEFNQQIEELRKEREEALSAASQYHTVDREHADALAAKEGDISAINSRLRDLQEQAEMLREDLDTKERLYRTAQARLHRMGRMQMLLKGACAVLAVFLAMILATNIKRTAVPQREVTAISEPVPYEDADLQTAPEEEEPLAKDKGAKGEDEDILLLAERGDADSGVREDARPPEESISYTVKKGDSLWLICQRELGDASVMKRVAQDNNLKNPNSLRVGDVIHLSKR